MPKIDKNKITQICHLYTQQLMFTISQNKLMLVLTGNKFAKEALHYHHLANKPVEPSIDCIKWCISSKKEMLNKLTTKLIYKPT